ncbi:hypothetical protein LCGC14_1035000 [marine sediment metagenome]|uniref:DUF7768 domain-containing protein n=1 Tax=marine sediment metagenome TaxID=412755 RepID=A0A0F9QZI6_9ZZZZ
MRTIYVCHPYSGDPEGNRVKVLRICKMLADRGDLPIAPQIYLPQFVDEATRRKLAMEMCVALLTACDEILVCGGVVSPGMLEEINFANAMGIRPEYLREIPEPADGQQQPKPQAGA